MVTNIDSYEPMCGDVCMVGAGKESGGVASRLISFFTRGRGEEPTLAQHQKLVLENEEVLEIGLRDRNSIRLFKRSKIFPLRARLSDVERGGLHYIIFRPPTNRIQRILISACALTLVGSRYGWFWDIPLQALDGTLRKLGLLREHKPFSSRMSNVFPFRGTMICSSIANFCLAYAGVVPHTWKYFTPDCTFDKMVSLGWEVVLIDPDGEGYWSQQVMSLNERSAK